MRTRFLVAAALAALPLAAQLDERRVTSPNGQIEFRLFIAPPPDAASLDGLAYQVWVRGKMLLQTSYLGLHIYSQEPLLGEKVGLVTSHVSSQNGSRTLLAEYLQNGSLGRRINVEVRAFDDGVAFRYVIPRSAPLDDILIQGEVTEFRFAPGAAPRIAQTASDTKLATPFVAEAPGVAWVALSETSTDGYPHMTLLPMGGGKLQTILPMRQEEPRLAYSGRTPLTTPWRVVAIGASKDGVAQAGITGRLQ